MNRSKNNFSKEKPENSAMATVNILGRLRTATEQVRKIQTSLARNGKYSQINSINSNQKFIRRYVRTYGNLG
jgi:hypothetical protein